MKTVIVGHRGTGKTSLLSRIENYYAKAGRVARFIDLDREIERRSGRKVSEIFADGESSFRKTELDTFRLIETELGGEPASRSPVNTSTNTRANTSANADVFLVVGAGFDVSLISNGWRVLWVRRSTDANGRVFLDRPRLNRLVSPLDEYAERHKVRDTRFRDRADEVLWLDEGLDRAALSDPTEEAFFVDGFKDLGGALTLLPRYFARGESLARRLQIRSAWGVRWFELRDDLLSIEQMEFALTLIPDDRVLVSFRDPARVAATRDLVLRHGLAFDWPVEMGPWQPHLPEGEPHFLSLHARPDGMHLAEAFLQFPKDIPSGTQLKAALPIHDFSELREAHRWQQAAAETRIFLPLSADGRWSWYRLLRASDYELNFFREDEGSGADQPTLLEWARRRGISGGVSDGSKIAAVLGDPVKHSRTPLEQRSFFAARGASVFAIRVTEDEWRAGAIEFLRSLGLRWAAVTAPLKGLAFETCVFGDSTCEALQAVNTLKWSEQRGEWIGTNTDLAGFERAVEAARVAKPVAVWGGGGTLGVVHKVLPEAQLFSVRTGENRVTGGVRAADFSPQSVIWAVGRSRDAAFVPPSTWRPELVLDLNYAEDSPGREFALSIGCRYISGLAMFEAQAEAQRNFWGQQ